MKKRHIALDLDGTLCSYDRFRGIDHIGVPIPAMLEKLDELVSQGHDVEIFTARVSPSEDGFDGDPIEAEKHIREFLKLIGHPDLVITCIKKKKFDEFWDDRAIQVVKNTGEFK